MAAKRISLTELLYNNIFLCRLSTLFLNCFKIFTKVFRLDEIFFTNSSALLTTRNNIPRNTSSCQTNFESFLLFSINLFDSLLATL